MSYLVLARKYRPRTFDDMVGQEVAAGTLRGAIAEGRIGHAYLFSGPRGTGKTTSARLFAKALNCERGPTSDPCGECDRCQAADAGAEADLIEMDAASNRGIDAIRDLLSQVAYAPMRARFKVYILDEAHMLTKEASNALLKTLEEPPAHVKFFLATTEPEKVLATIRSRCQMIQLAPLSEEQITARLEWVFARENIQAEPRVASELARRARGGLRDALSSADQLLSLSGTRPTLADVERLAGSGGAEELEKLCDALEAGDPARALSLLPRTRGGEVELSGALLEHVRATLLVGLCGADNPFVEADADLRARWRVRAQKLGTERLQAWLEELLAARERMRLLPAHARVVLESALLALARTETSWPLSELAERLLSLEERLGRGAVASAPATHSGPPATAARHEPALARETAVSVPETGGRAERGGTPAASGTPAVPRTAPPSRTPTQPSDVWKSVLIELGIASPTLAELLRQRGRLIEIAAAHVLVRCTLQKPEERVLLGDSRNKKACTQAFARVLGREIEVRFGDAEPPQRAPKDPFTTRVTELFGGRIEEDA